MTNVGSFLEVANKNPERRMPRILLYFALTYLTDEYAP